MIEYRLELTKEISDKLVKLSEESGEDNELAFIEQILIDYAENNT